MARSGAAARGGLLGIVLRLAKSLCLAGFGALLACFLISFTVPAPVPGFLPNDVRLGADHEKRAVEHISQFLQKQTVADSSAPRSVGASAPHFASARSFLQEAYEPLFARDDVTVTQVNEWSMLVEWRGGQPELKPAMLYGHFDVVPVSNSSLRLWKHGPFSGDVADGEIWGRGALDMKSSLIAMLEAWSHLAATGFRPARTLLLGIGHDEEVGGRQGAAKIADHLRARGARLDILVDEGTLVLLDGAPPLLSTPLALVGTAEKGSSTYKVSVDTPGGHSSMPPLNGLHTARVMADIVRAIDTKPPPAAIKEPLASFMRGLAPYAPFPLRGTLSKAGDWRFDLILQFIWSRLGPATAAQVRTTAVVTKLEAGVANNVVPQHGEVVVNMRLLPGDSVDEGLAYLNERIAAIGRQNVTSVECVEVGRSSEVTPAEGPWWDAVAQAIQETLVPAGKGGRPPPLFPVLPTLVSGGTDSKHIGQLSDNGVYRFLPLRVSLKAGQLDMVHGNNERIRVADFLAAVRFYVRLSELLSAVPGPAPAAAAAAPVDDEDWLNTDAP